MFRRESGEVMRGGRSSKNFRGEKLTQQLIVVSKTKREKNATRCAPPATCGEEAPMGFRRVSEPLRCTDTSSRYIGTVSARAGVSPAKQTLDDA